MVRLSHRAGGKAVTEIVGIEQLEKSLDQLPKRLNRKLLNQACRGSAKYVHQAARWNVQPHSKIAAKQTKIWALKGSRRAGVWVGWNTKQADKDYRELQHDRSKAMWALKSGMWLEFGAKGVDRGIGRRAPYKGTQYHPTQPVGWFRRAVDTKLPQTERDFKKVLHKKINQFLDKWITKHGW